MQASTKIQNDIVVISLRGRVDVETAEPFRGACLRELRGKKVVFDFTQLSFVGSQGILPFLETMQTLQELAPGSFKFSSVGIEFRRVFAATPLEHVEIYETSDRAVTSFTAPTQMVSPIVAQPAPMADYLSFRPEVGAQTAPAGNVELEDDQDLELDA